MSFDFFISFDLILKNVYCYSSLYYKYRPKSIFDNDAQISKKLTGHF